MMSSKKILSYTYAGFGRGFLNQPPVRPALRQASGAAAAAAPRPKPARDKNAPPPRSSRKDATIAALTAQLHAKIDEEKRKKGGEALTPQDYTRVADVLSGQIRAILQKKEEEKEKKEKAQTAPAAPRSTQTGQDTELMTRPIKTHIRSTTIKEWKASLGKVLIATKIAANLEAKLTDAQPLSIPINYSDNPIDDPTAVAAVAAVEALQRAGKTLPSEAIMASKILKHLLKTAPNTPSQTVYEVNLLNNCFVLGRDPHLALKDFQMTTSILFYSVIKAVITGFEDTILAPRPEVPELNYNLLRKFLYDMYELTIVTHFESKNLNCISFPDGSLVAKIQPDMKEEEKFFLEESILFEYKDGLPSSAYLDLFHIDLLLNCCRLDAFYAGGIGHDQQFASLFPMKVRFNHRSPSFGKSDFLKAINRPAPKPLGIDPVYIPLYKAAKKKMPEFSTLSSNDKSKDKSLMNFAASLPANLIGLYLRLGGTQVAGELMYIMFKGQEAGIDKMKVPALALPNIDPVYIPIYKLFKKYRQIKLTTFRANKPVGLSLVASTAKCLSKIYDLLHKARMAT